MEQMGRRDGEYFFTFTSLDCEACRFPYILHVRIFESRSIYSIQEFRLEVLSYTAFVRFGLSLHICCNGISFRYILSGDFSHLYIVGDFLQLCIVKIFLSIYIVRGLALLLPALPKGSLACPFLESHAAYCHLYQPVRRYRRKRIWEW